MHEVFDENFYEIFPWARGVDPFDAEKTIWYVAERYYTGLRMSDDESIGVPLAVTFIDDLISLEMDDLALEDYDCPIFRAVLTR